LRLSGDDLDWVVAMASVAFVAGYGCVMLAKTLVVVWWEQLGDRRS